MRRIGVRLGRIRKNHYGPAVSDPVYNQGVRYPEGMNPFKAGSLLFKLANQKAGMASGSKKKKRTNSISKKMTNQILGKAAAPRGGNK